jgi:DNA-binding winged helix-turn-helix (wHTH) protein
MDLGRRGVWNWLQGIAQRPSLWRVRARCESRGTPQKGDEGQAAGPADDILVLLLQRPGEIVTRDELQKDLWPADTFVGFEQGLNNAMMRLRAALDDDAESPHLIETLPRRGYRFIAPVESAGTGNLPVEALNDVVPKHAPKRAWTLRLLILFGGCVLLLGTGFYLYKLRKVSESPRQRTLTRVTFGDGLQSGATWSPDGRFIAYASARDGKFDIWVQQVSGGDPVRITKGPGHNWQPDWSPDGKFIAYRSEDREGGLYIVPALGGAGQERRISPFGYYPRWSPDSSEVLFQTEQFASMSRFYVVGLDDGPPREVLADLAVGPNGPVSGAVSTRLSRPI